MAISKIVLNSTTQIDLTQDTVSDASHIRNGYVGHLNDGTQVTGNYTGSSPSLQARTNINPSTSSQTIEPDSGYDGLSSVQINAMPSMTLPTAATSSSSGTSQGTITPTSSAQYLNIPTGYNSAAAYYTIAAGGGGASNIVTGTFTGTTTGAAMDVALNYSGSGWPVACIIYATGGPVPASGDFYDLIKRYAISANIFIKNNTEAPTYTESGDNNTASYYRSYKSSASLNSAYSGAVSTGNSSYYGFIANSNASSSKAISFKSATTMSVFIASTSYGFAANIPYTYHIIYSS